MITLKSEGFTESIRISGMAILLCCTLTAETVQAGDSQWVLRQATPSGQIFHRDSGEFPIAWVMIVTDFDAPPARVHTVVTDYNHFAEFIPFVAESRIILEEGDQQWVYHHLEFPGLIADRAYLFNSTSRASLPEENFFRVEWDLTDRVFAAADLSVGIRPKAFSGYWELSPGTQPGSTRAHYTVVSDPGGLIPNWLVVKNTDRYVRMAVEAVRERLATVH
jgi:hypothetical protein